MKSTLQTRLAITFGVFFLISAATASTAFAGDFLWKEQSPSEHKQYIKSGFNEGMIKLSKDSLPAVVSVYTTKNMKNPFTDQRLKEFFKYFGLPDGNIGKSKALGSGFVISPKGYVVTNNHVVENADEVMVAFREGGEEYKARVVGTYKMTDLALLKIDVKHDLPVVPLGDSDKLQVGELVVAIGNPLGLSHTVTMGIVSQKGRKDIQPGKRQIYSNFIQTDASINPGNSGGPLINSYGEVVGINTAMANAQGIGFAVPINMVKQVLPQLLEHGRVKKSWLGIQMQQVTPELMKSLGMKNGSSGALVVSVMPDSPADRARLLPEDVIVEIDNRPISSPGDLSWLVSVAGEGKRVKIKVWRNGRYKNLSVTLGLAPGENEISADRDNNKGDKVKAGPKLWGMSIRDLARSEMEKLPSAAKGGVMVIDVERNSAPANAGIRPGDILLRINGKPVMNTKGLIKRTKRAKKGTLVRFLVLNARENAMFFVAFRI